MSKMGISTYMSYTGAQIFEAVGLSRALVDKYFTGTTSNVEGIGVFEVAEEAIRIHQAAFSDDPVLEGDAGRGRRVRLARARRGAHVDARRHRQAAAFHARTTPTAPTRNTRHIINDQSKRHMTLRGLFEFKFDQCTPVPIEEVEPANEIVKRFSTGAMSLGSISTEAHTNLAIAMNRIGGKSNTGEGGEDQQALRADQGRRDAGLAPRARPRGARHSELQGRRFAQVQDQAGGVRPLRRDRRVPGLAPSSSRSRSRRAPSRARAGSCRAARYPSTSPSCATRRPASS